MKMRRKNCSKDRLAQGNQNRPRIVKSELSSRFFQPFEDLQDLEGRHTKSEGRMRER